MPDNERRERFKRLATKRTNAVLRKLDILSNCADRRGYKYTKEEVDKIFRAINKRIEKTRSKFEFPDEGEEEFCLRVDHPRE